MNPAHPMAWSDLSYGARTACAGLFLALVISVAVPIFVHAQTQTSDLSALKATIRTSIMQDPRAGGLTSAEIDAMVSALTSKAQTQGLRVQDLTYVPGGKGITVPGVTDAPQPTAVTDPCAASAGCMLGERIGGGLIRSWVYVAFWVLSLMLIFIVRHMLKNIHLFAEPEKREILAIGGKA